MELTGNPLADIAAPIKELQESFDSAFVIDFGGGVGLTQYTFWMIIVFLIITIGILVAVRKVTLIPHNKFAGLVEYGYDAVKRNMGEGAVGPQYKKHMNFLVTLFFFILISNIVGLIPSFKTPTGSLSITWALAALSFVYFNYWGIRAKGGWGYIKSIAPSGLPAPLVPVIWLFEFISLCIRLLTLAVRLYGNMFAGHIILGIFAILTNVFILDAIYSGVLVAGLPSIAWFLFVVVMYALECIVAFLQAYVFTILSAVYIGLAIGKH